ncbi:MAG: COX15/CtaA family protein [Gammaproteobacteria bacterium]
MLAFLASIYTYALVVFGGMVRITGSGMGCGPDWPRCNGEWIPTFTFETLIEYMHRLLAAGIGIVVLAVLGYALVHRHIPGIGGKGGALRPLAAAAVLLVAQALLGAITVWLELPTEVTVAHFVTAMIFMATLILAAVRGGLFGAPASHDEPTAWRLALTTASLGLVVVGLGAVTANTAGAPTGCMGFPLCNGRLLPPAGVLPAEIQWAHRLAAFALLLLALAGAWNARRDAVTSRVQRAATVAATLVAVQIGVAAMLMLFRLPPSLQALRLAAGAAVWFALVVWAALARQDTRAPA